MGIDVRSVQFFCCAKSIGVDFSDTMMVGRQVVYLTYTDLITSALSTIGIPREQIFAALKKLEQSPPAPAEPLFSLLGAKQVSSVDISDYEGATHIHDFNQPLPASLAGQFSVVHDGGTIEHVFNIPQAFKNCMEMLRVGGHFIQLNNANNYMGHGFWQFCPELIYRIFSRENGFQIKAVLMNVHVMRHPGGASLGRWYKVEDPAKHHCRVELTNDRPTCICTIAQRVEDKRIFATLPTQSDYVEFWKRTQERRHEIEGKSSTVFSIRRMIPRPVKKLIRWSLNPVSGVTRNVAWRPFDRPYYKSISDQDVVLGRI
jgi:hypothetical protein